MKKVSIMKDGERHDFEYNTSKAARKSGENVTKYKVTLAGRSSGSHHLVMFPDFCAKPCPEGGDVQKHGEEQNQLRAEYFAWMPERALYEALHATGFTPAEAPTMSDGLAEQMRPTPAEPAPQPEPEPEGGEAWEDEQ